MAEHHAALVPDITDNDPNNDEIGVFLDPQKDGSGNNLCEPRETRQQPRIMMIKSAALG